MSATMAEDDKNLWFIPEEAAVDPHGIVQVYRDHWWVTHPTKGLAIFGKGSAQCSTNKDITRLLAKIYPWCEVKFFSLVFVPIDPRDY